LQGLHGIYSLDGKYVKPHQPDEGGASFFQSSRGGDRSANVKITVKFHDRLQQYVAVFSPTRVIEKGEELLYSYDWRTAVGWPWHLFVPAAALVHVFPERADVEVQAEAFDLIGYSLAHAACLREHLEKRFGQ
jgi:hypothetical protein